MFRSLILLFKLLQSEQSVDLWTLQGNLHFVPLQKWKLLSDFWIHLCSWLWKSPRVGTIPLHFFSHIWLQGEKLLPINKKSKQHHRVHLFYTPFYLPCLVKSKSLPNSTATPKLKELLHNCSLVYLSKFFGQRKILDSMPGISSTKDQ